MIIPIEIALGISIVLSVFWMICIIYKSIIGDEITRREKVLFVCYICIFIFMIFTS